MKKTITKGILAVLLVISIFGTGQTFAVYDETGPSITEDNIKEKFSKAVNDYNKSSTKHPVYGKLEDSDGNEYKIQVFEDSVDKGSNSNMKSQTYIYSIDSKYMTPTKSGSTQTVTGWDNGSTNVYGYMTLYYNTTIKDGSTCVLITRFSGGWTKYDTTCSITSRFVNCQCWDPGNIGSQNATVYPTGSTYNYNSNFTYYAIRMNGTGQISGYQEATIKRGTQTWTFGLENVISSI